MPSFLIFMFIIYVFIQSLFSVFMYYYALNCFFSTYLI